MGTVNLPTPGQRIEELQAENAALPKPEPVAYSFELGTHFMDAYQEYGKWEKRLSFDKPNVPRAGIRNFSPLYAEAPIQSALACAELTKVYEACITACTEVRANDGDGQHAHWYGAIDLCISALKSLAAKKGISP